MNYYQGTNQGTNNSIDWNQRKTLIVELIKENDKISMSEIQEKLGLSERQISRTIKMLKEDGILERGGSSRTGYWIIK